ncbi:MAG: class I SAM-dependent methyltransferase [Planctomycetota bacterium]
MESTPCPLCGQDAFVSVMKGRDLLFFCPGEFSIVRCTACAHAYLNPRPTLAEIGKFYPDDYGPHADESNAAKSDAGEQAIPVVESQDGDDAPKSEPWYLSGFVRAIPGLRGFYYWLMRDRALILPDVPRSEKRALDLGCGSGGDLVRLRDQGWNAEGVELTPAAAEIARSRGFRVFTGTLEEAEFDNQTFDAVFASMVVEHLHDPIATLREIDRILAEDGWVVFTVPNFGCWERWFFGRFWYALETPRHLQHFTPRTLKNMLQGEGYRQVRVVHQETCNQVFGSLGIMLRQSGKMNGLANRLVDVPHRPSMFGNLLRALPAKLLAWCGQAGRLTVLAQKPLGDKSS